MNLYRDGYSDMTELWARIEASLEGKPKVNSSKYLVQYESETDIKYDYRRKWSSYHGLPATIQDAKLGIFKRGSISFTPPTKASDMVNDVDLSGTPIARWREQGFTELDDYGSIWVLIDTPANDVQPASELERQQMGIRPYAAIQSPANVVNFELDQFGKLTMVLLDLHKKHEAVGKQYDVYRLYTLKEREAVGENTIADIYFSGEGDKVEMRVVPNTERPNTMTDENGKPKLPWIYAGMKRSKTMPGYYVSPNAAISDVAIDLFIRRSQLNTLFAKAAFCFLALPDAQAGIKTLSETTFLPMRQGDPTPQWIAPPADLFDTFQQDIDGLVTQIFTVARKTTKAVDTGASAKSGAALSIEASEEEASVGSIAETLQQVEQKMWEMLCRAMSSDTSGMMLEYPETWDVKSYNEELDRLERIAKQRNRPLYLYESEQFANRKVQNAEARQAVIDAYKASVNLRIEEVGANNLDLLSKLGVMSLIDIARDTNPDYDDAVTDEQIASDIMENAQFRKQVLDEVGVDISRLIGSPQEQPANEETQEDNATTT